VPQLKIRKARGAAVLAVTAVPLCEAVVREVLVVLAKTGYCNAVLDLKGLAPDPSLVKPLLTLRRDLQKRRGRLVLCGLSGETEELFRATWLLGLFEVRPDVDSALACLRFHLETDRPRKSRPTPRNGVGPVHPDKPRPARRRKGVRPSRNGTPNSLNGRD